MNESQARALGRLITSARVKQGQSLRALNRYTGITLTWLLGLEAGSYLKPGVDRLMAVASVLKIDPDEINQITGGYLAARLPSTRSYFRAKHGLDDEHLNRVEKLLKELDAED